VYQLGRGSEPVIVVGSMMSFVAQYIAKPPKFRSHQDFPRRDASLKASPVLLDCIAVVG
jgi:hypothetical protein